MRSTLRVTEMPTSSEHDSIDAAIDALGQKYIELFRKGAAPSVEEFALRHPVYEDKLRNLLPAMVFAEQLNRKNYHQQSDELELPAKLGQFVLHREIGRGGMGIVYEATQEQLSQKFAIKVLRSQVIHSTSLSERFAREAEVASRLHHPNIVPPRHYGKENDHHFLAMSYIDGISLDRLIQNADQCDIEVAYRFNQLCSDWTRFAEFGASIASALLHAHDKGMVHRDIKPANLILDRKGSVWVTDFGLAKLYDESSVLSRTGELVGTPRYMSPEQLVGVADARSDIYGVGLTLYEMLTKQCPWRDKQLIHSLKHSRHSSSVLEIPDICKLNPSVPPKLGAIIMKACAHYPELRFQSARELEFALNEIAFDGTGNRRSSQRSLSQHRKQQARGVATLAATLMIGWISLALLWQDRNKTRVTLPPVEMTLASHGLPKPTDYTPPETNCVVFQAPGSNLTTVVTRVFHSADDVEEYGDGKMYLDSRDLELTWDEVDQKIGLRFAGVLVPPNARIHSAKISFTCWQSTLKESTFLIQALDEADPQRFTPIAYDLTDRPKTEQVIQWTPGHWLEDQTIDSPDCSELVQHLVDKPGWKSGNAIGFAIDGKGYRVATSFDGNIHYGPVLTIQYESDPDTPNERPPVNPDLAQHYRRPVLGEPVKVFWGRKWWKANIVEVDGERYKIRYHNHDASWDTWKYARQLRWSDDTPVVPRKEKVDDEK